ncbi:MAG TPA: hypothetical protein VF824_02415 [Thermoanaerobaculia bacterium]|jgi:hypothetical protein
MARRLFVTLLSLLALFALVAAKRRSVRSPGIDAPLRPERSFAITDAGVLAPFRFERVLAQLAARADVPGLTAEKLFRQWMDTQNPKPGLDAAMPHCDDELVNGKPSLNGFARGCPTNEGPRATAPFHPDAFIPIAITNRFDMADGAQCGEYRIVFADTTVSSVEVFHIIFEGVLPNPRPELGLAGCRPVAQFWADLSAVESRTERRDRLERFFFDGISGFAPVIDPAHYSTAPAGIRTLQATLPVQATHFLQFRLVRECTNGTCRAIMKPDALENAPFGDFLDARVTTPQAQRFRDAFVAQVKDLAVRDVNLYFMSIPNEFLLGDTQPTPSDLTFILDRPFSASLVSSEGLAFKARIDEALRASGSTLSAQQVVARAETMGCVGCHFLSGDVGEGVRFPPPLQDQQHVSEKQFTFIGQDKQFAISPAMRDVFIPHRMQILRDFLVSGKAPVHSN